MKKLMKVKNYKVTMDYNVLNNTGEIYKTNHEEFFFMTKEEAKEKMKSYAESYELWKTIKENVNGFKKIHKSPDSNDNITVSMQEVNLIGTVKYKVILSEEYDFSQYPSTVEVFASIKEAQEYFNNLLKEKREDWERGSYVEIKEDTNCSFKAEAPGDKISITLEEFVEQYAPIELWEVKGTDDLEGMTFAVCTSKEKALEAEKLLKTQGFEGLGFEDLEIKKSNINLDEIKIGQDTISF